MRHVGYSAELPATYNYPDNYPYIYPYDYPYDYYCYYPINACGHYCLYHIHTRPCTRSP